MDRYASDRDYGQHEGSSHTHRSERYRHPESDYGARARGGYGNQMGRARQYEDIHVTPYDRFEQSHNYGSMGSYGGMQGFGDIRGGHHDPTHPYDSGTGSPRRYSEERYRPSGYSGDRGEGRDYGRSGRHMDDFGRRSYDHPEHEDWYGREPLRRFEGRRGEGRYRFERDDYYSSNYGDDQGNYMGSGYQRDVPGRYGTGDYGSIGHFEQNHQPGGAQERRRTREFNTVQNRWNTDW
jgi:hypothetical protein